MLENTHILAAIRTLPPAPSFPSLMELYHLNYVLFCILDERPRTGAGILTRKGGDSLHLSPTQKTAYTETFNLMCTLKSRAVHKPLSVLQFKLRVYYDLCQIEVLAPLPGATPATTLSRPGLLPHSPFDMPVLKQKWQGNRVLNQILRHFKERMLQTLPRTQ